MANPGVKEKLLRDTGGRVVRGGGLDGYLPGGRWAFIKDILGMHLQVFNLCGDHIMGNVKLLLAKEGRMGPEQNILGLPRRDTQEGRDLASRHDSRRRARARRRKAAFSNAAAKSDTHVGRRRSRAPRIDLAGTGTSARTISRASKHYAPPADGGSVPNK